MSVRNKKRKNPVKNRRQMEQKFQEHMEIMAPLVHTLEVLIDREFVDHNFTDKVFMDRFVTVYIARRPKTFEACASIYVEIFNKVSNASVVSIKFRPEVGEFTLSINSPFTKSIESLQ